MNAERYARVRELFLAADELPEDEREDFIRRESAGDETLVREVMQLLGEHDPEAAKAEGERQSIPAVTRPPHDSTPSDVDSKAKQISLDDDSRRLGANALGENDARRQPHRTSGDSTLRWAQRTHAQPRFESAAKRENPPSEIRPPRVAPKRKKPLPWRIFLATVIPTALIGWITYGRVHEYLVAHNESTLKALIAAASSTVDEFLKDELRTSESWGRDSRIRDNVLSLVTLARDHQSESPESLSEKLRAAPASKAILAALQELSKRESIHFVVWTRTGETLATSCSDQSTCGALIEMSQIAALSRVMRGESVLVGPMLQEAQSPAVSQAGEVATRTSDVSMGVIVPILNDQGRPEAAFRIDGTDLYPRLNAIMNSVAKLIESDCYLVTRDGILASESSHAFELARTGVIDAKPEMLVGRLRIAAPGTSEMASTIQRHGQPLTNAAGGLSVQGAGHSSQPYSNYAGQPVIGAWRSLPRYELGLVTEMDASDAFRPASIVGWSFSILGFLLAGTVLGTCAFQKLGYRREDSPDPLSKYEIGKPLGSGGMGVVFEAKHRHLGRPTALKVLRADRQEPDDLLRFDREARVAATLVNPHIVSIYDYGRTSDGEFFTAMQLLKGLTLHEVVARSGPQSIGRVLFILRQVCDALVEAHQAGLLHRDIKPQNIMLSLDASVGDWAVVFDFGLAKPLEATPGLYQTSEAIWSGTPMYMAPERFRDPKSMDLRSDLYSLGCVAYYLLSGRPPFSECDPESLFALIISQHPISLQTHLGHAVPEEIETLVMRCMAKSVEERFASAKQVASVLDALCVQYPWSAAEARHWWKIHGAE